MPIKTSENSLKLVEIFLNLKSELEVSYSAYCLTSKFKNH